MGQPADFSTAASRIGAGEEAGDTYETTLESIRDNLVGQGGQTNLGRMVGAQLSMTEAETRYQISKGLPSAASKSAKDAAGGIQKAAG